MVNPFKLFLKSEMLMDEKNNFIYGFISSAYYFLISLCCTKENASNIPLEFNIFAWKIVYIIVYIFTEFFGSGTHPKYLRIFLYKSLNYYNYGLIQKTEEEIFWTSTLCLTFDMPYLIYFITQYWGG